MLKLHEKTYLRINYYLSAIDFLSSNKIMYYLGDV